MGRAQNTVKRDCFWRPGVSAAGAAAQIRNLGSGSCFQDSTLESWVRPPVFRSQLWNLRSVHLLSGINSRIPGLRPAFKPTRFQESTLESWMRAPVFRSQLWNLRCGHLFAGINFECWVRAPVFRSQLWNPGCLERTWFQESTLESWARVLVSKVNPGTLGPVHGFKRQIRNLGSGSCFQDSTLESWVRPPVFRSQLWNLRSVHLLSGINSRIPSLRPAFKPTRFQESTLESWVRAPVFRSQLWNLRCGHLFAGINFECWVRAPVFRSQLWNLGCLERTWFQEWTLESWARVLVSKVNPGTLGPVHGFKRQIRNLGSGSCFQDSTLESWVRPPVFRSQLWNLRSVHLLSGINSRIPGLRPAFKPTRFQESTLESWVRAPVFRSQLWNLRCGHLFAGINFECWVRAPVFRSQLWKLGCLERTWFQESTLESWARVLVSKVNPGTLGPVHGFKRQIRNLGSGGCFQDSTLESWVRPPVFRSQLWNLGSGHLLSGSTLESLVWGLFSRLNSGILGPGTRFQKSALESRFSDRDFLSGVGTGLKSQLWNLGLGHPFSGVNSGIFGPAPAFRNQLWYHGSGHLFQEAILVFRNQLQEFWWGAPVFWSQLWNLGPGDLMLLGVNSGILGWSPFLVWAICFQEPVLAALES